MAHYVMIRHKVKDFSHWRSVYDAHRPAREKAGITEKYLLRDMQDPNDVLLFYQLSDLERVKAFMATPDLKEKMQQAGVVGGPVVQILTD